MSCHSWGPQRLEASLLPFVAIDWRIGLDGLEENAHSMPTPSAWPLLNLEVTAALLVG